MVGHHAGALPWTPCGAGEQLLRPMLPATRPTPWPGTSGPCRPGGQGGAAGTPAKRGPGLGSTLMRAGHDRPPHHPFPSGPMPAGDHAARRPRRHVDPLRPTGAAGHSEPLQVQHGGDSAAAAPPVSRRPVPCRCPDGQASVSAAAAALSARPVGRTSPRRDRTRRTGRRRAGRCPDILATGDIRWADRPSPGLRRPAALDHPGRLRVTAPAPRPSPPPPLDSCPAPLGMRPRPGALLSSEELGRA